MTEKEILSDNNFHHIILSVPKETVEIIMKCKVLCGGDVKTAQGTFDMEAIRQIRNDFCELWEGQRKECPNKTKEINVIPMIPKNTMSINLFCIVFQDGKLLKKEFNYDTEEVRKMRNEYLKLDPDDDFFSYWVLNP